MAQALAQDPMTAETGLKLYADQMSKEKWAIQPGDAYGYPGRKVNVSNFGGIKELGEDPTKLNKLLTERNTIAQRNPDDPSIAAYDAAISKESTRSGFSLVQGPDGSLEVSYGAAGGGGGLDKIMTRKMQGGIMDDQDTLDSLTYTESLYEDDFGTRQGRVGAWTTGELEKLKIADPSEFGARHDTWLSQQRQFFNQYRKWVTGVAGGEKEMNWIRESIPNADDAASRYRAKMAAIKMKTRKLLARKAAALREGINPGSDLWADFLRENPIQGFPSAQERGDELERMGYPPQQILQILREEGYGSMGGAQ
jgi:hypothetical protein